MNKQKILRFIVFPFIMVIVWLLMANYTFNVKPDTNGDNIRYYALGMALAEGKGYCDIISPNEQPTNNFPPGYPALMVPLLKITDSIIAQKWLNEFFLLLSVILLYFILLRLNFSDTLSFVASCSIFFLHQVLHFSTMMMSEMSTLLFSVLTLYAFVRLTEEEADDFWSELKNKWFYVMLFALVYSFHIRTQMLALVMGLLLYFVFNKRWGASMATLGGFVLGIMPWMIRNKLLGLESRYLNMLTASNLWRPEEGTLEPMEMVARAFDTVRMLIFNAMPASLFPFMHLNPDNATYSFTIYLVGALVFIAVCYGFWKIKRLRWVLAGYLAATIGIISLFSTPSGARYLTVIVPLLNIAEIIAIATVISLIIKKITPKFSEKIIYFMPLTLFLLFLSGATWLDFRHKSAHSRWLEAYDHFIHIAKKMRYTAKETDVFICRKSELCWLYTRKKSITYPFTQDPDEMMQFFLDNNVSYIFYGGFRYSSEGRYLFPTIKTFPAAFPIKERKGEKEELMVLFEMAREVAQDLLREHKKFVEEKKATQDDKQ